MMNNTKLPRPSIDDQILKNQFVKNYQRVNQSNVFEDFKRLFQLGSLKSEHRINIQQKIFAKLMNVTNLSQNQQQMLFSNKKTENSKLLKELILKNQQAHKRLEMIRQKVLLDVRYKRDIKEEDKQLMDQLMMIFGITDETTDIESVARKNQYKKYLISLRKMLGNPLSTKTLDSKERSLAYKLNLDLKHYLFRASQLIEDQTIKNELLKILQEKQYKNWIGIKFYKHLSGDFWTNQKLEIVYKSLLLVKIQQRQLLNKSFIKAIKRLKANLRKEVKARKIIEISELKIETFSPQVQQQISSQRPQLSFNQPKLFQEQDLCFLGSSFSLLDQLCQIDEENEYIS